MVYSETALEPRPPYPPFTLESAQKKVQAAEAAWNTREPYKVAMAYTPDSVWRNRSEFFQGRAAIVEFLKRKWDREKEYYLEKTLWAYTGNKIAVRFEYEWCNSKGQWIRSYGNEMWEFSDNGLMRERHASINDVEIQAHERRLKRPSMSGSE